MQENLITSLAVLVESRDNSTGGHVVRTSDCIKIILPTFKRNQDFTWCTEDFCNRLIKAAPMHDLGKIAVNDAILRKPGRFTPDEYEQMKIHAAKGAVIVEQVLKATTDFRFKQIAINIAHYHLASLPRIEAEHGSLVLAVLANLGGGAFTGGACLV